jgi:hypothetical protein
MLPERATALQRAEDHGRAPTELAARFSAETEQKVAARAFPARRMIGFHSFANSGRCKPVYLCVGLYISSDCADRQFSAVIQIADGPNARSAVANSRKLRLGRTLRSTIEGSALEYKNSSTARVRRGRWLYRHNGELVLGPP